MRESTQILVIGAGPAGCTTAGLLAREGFQVTLLERNHFPRYHIGESLLPSCIPIFQFLGVMEKIEKHGFKKKPGVFFKWGPENWGLSYDRLETSHTWQVLRSEFDKLLLDHTAELGAEIYEGISVHDIAFKDGRAVAANWVDIDNTERRGTINFDYVVDASGVVGLLPKQLKTRKFNENFANISVWQYYRGTHDLEGAPKGGGAGVCTFPNGWFWVIPLEGGITSIGVVTDRERFTKRRSELNSINAAFAEAVTECPEIQAVLKGAEPVSSLKAVQKFAYYTDTLTGPGYIITGDSANFIDPLLSAGVSIAGYGGMLSAASIATVLRGGMSEQDAFGFYQKIFRRAYERTVVLVSAFYETYSGKDDGFFRAQRLSKTEKDSLNLHETMRRLIPGIEDLKEDKEAAYSFAVEKLTCTVNGDNNPFNKLHGMRDEPVSAEFAIGGVYLNFVPRLELIKVDQGMQNNEL